MFTVQFIVYAQSTEKHCNTTATALITAVITASFPRPCGITVIFYRYRGNSGYYATLSISRYRAIL